MVNHGSWLMIENIWVVLQFGIAKLENITRSTMVYGRMFMYDMLDL